MHYRHAEDGGFEDLASGHVVRSAPGQPAFPVRLGIELLHRARQHLPRPERPVTVWDPCCGAAQLLVTLGLAARPHLARVVASDVDEGALELARANLRLLSTTGLEARRRALLADAQRYGKASHRAAAAAADRLAELLAAGGGDLPTAVRRVDALDPAAVAEVADAEAPHVVVADVPHGRMTRWTGERPEATTGDLAVTLGAVLPPATVVVLVARARRVHLPEGVRAGERLRAGHRAAVIVRASELAAARTVDP